MSPINRIIKYWQAVFQFHTFAAVAVGTAVASAGISAGVGASQASSARSAANKAADRQREQAKIAQEYQQKAIDQARQDLSPYLQSGQTSNAALSNLLGLGPNQTPETSYLGKPFTYQDWMNQPGNPYGQSPVNLATMANYATSPFEFNQKVFARDVGYTPQVNTLEQLQATPGYQFRLGQGEQLVNNSAAAKGGLLSGNTLKALTDYGQGFASTEYQNAWQRYQQAVNDAYQRRLGAYNTNQDAFTRAQNAYQNAFQNNQATKAMLYGGLQNMTTGGQTAAENIGRMGVATGQNQANVATGLGNDLATQQLLIGKANQQEAQGIGNALQGGLGNALFASQKLTKPETNP